MEKLVGNNPSLKSQNKPSKAKKKPIKIKYISSPMMVRANNASEFRAIVQELTGQNSNVSEISEAENNAVVDDHSRHYNYSPTCELGQTTSWFTNSTTTTTTYYHEEEAYRSTVVDHNSHQFSNPNNGTGSSFLAQFDEGQFLRPEVVSETFNTGFQSSCVLV